jgi:DHA1 family inner membrane transport protein
MAFFRNSTVNLLNLHYGIHAIALTGGGAFFSAYLLKSGVSVPGVLLFFALVLVGRFIARPFMVGFAARFGMRRLVAAGTLLSAVQYPFLAGVHGVGAMLSSLVVVSSLADSLYWPSYHAYFAALGDHEHRGQQIGVREAIAAIVGVISPLALGWLLVVFGPLVAFGVIGVIVALAALPLYWMPDVPVAPAMPGAIRAAWPGVLIFVTDGWAAAGYVFVWQIALFLSLGENYLVFGGALAIAALVGAISGMVMGRFIDAGHGSRAAVLAYGLIAGIVVIRALALHNAALAVTANALSAAGGCLYIPTVMTAVYNQAQRAPCTLRFHVATEAGWDAGGAGGLLLCAGILALGLPMWSAVLTSLVGLAAGFVMIRRYYAAHPGLVPQPVDPPIESGAVAP